MALLTFAAVTDIKLFAVYGLALIVVHELGHILASTILKMRIYEISFGVANIDICKPQDYYTRRFSEKVFLILSGCILNFVVFLILYGAYICTKKSDFLFVAMQSMGIAVLNMLPIESLDGGELLDLCIERFSKNYEHSKQICDFISWLFLLLFLIIGIFIIVKCRDGFSVILLVFYLIYQKYI